MIGVVSLMHDPGQLEAYGRMVESVKSVFGKFRPFVSLNGDGVAPPGVRSFYREWTNFAANRNLALQDAQNTLTNCDYLLLLDPDMTIHGKPEMELEGSGYMVEVRFDGMNYVLPLLVKRDHPWRYAGVVHETLLDSGNLPTLPGVWLEHHGKPNYDRFQRDVVLLRQAVKDNPLDGRSWFYLGQTLRWINTPASVKEAAEAYEKRIEVGGWDEETYIAMYSRGCVLNDWQALLKAWEYRPHRGEALYAALGRLRNDGCWQTAYTLAGRGVATCSPREDRLFVEPGVYDWGLTFELSIAAWWVGDHHGCVALSDAVDRDGVPDMIRVQARANRGLCEPLRLAA